MHGRTDGGVMAMGQSQIIQDCQVLEKDENHIVFKLYNIIFVLCYYTPLKGNRDDSFQEFWTHMNDLCNSSNMEMIVLGDFNARLGELTGDHDMNSRGRWLSNQLDESSLKLQVPINGNRYTCFTDNGGCSIPDLIFSTFDVQGLRVIQDDLMCSDHAALMFEITPSNTLPYEFSRWNIRKFADPMIRQQFIDILKSKYQAIMDQLDDINDINQGWQLVKAWIEEAAQDSCGKFSFKWRKNNEIFDADTIRTQNELREAMKNLQDVVNNPRMNRSFRQRAQRAFTILQQEFKSKVASKTKLSFDKMVRNMAEPQNTGAFMHMVR